MTLLGTLSRTTAVALLSTAVACADDAARGTPQVQAVAAPTEPGPPPNLDVHMTGSAGSGYSIDASGTGFPPGETWDASIMAVLLDGTVIRAGGGGGVNPADGSFRMVYSGGCPSRFRDVYAFVVSNGRRTETTHIVPTC